MTYEHYAKLEIRLALAARLQYVGHVPPVSVSFPLAQEPDDISSHPDPRDLLARSRHVVR